MNIIGITTCPKCKTRVIPKDDGTCPSCQAIILKKEKNSESISIESFKKNETSTPLKQESSLVTERMTATPIVKRRRVAHGSSASQPELPKIFRTLFWALFVIGMLFFLIGIIQDLSVGRTDESVSGPANFALPPFMGLGAAFLVSGVLLAGLTGWITRLKREAAQLRSGGKMASFSHGEQKRETDKRWLKGVLAFLGLGAEARGPKDVFAGFVFGIFFILVGLLGLVEGHHLTLVNAPDGLIPIASIFNLILGSVSLWKGMVDAKTLLEKWLRKKL